MSDIFAEATARITPSLTGFVKDLNEQLTEAMKKVKTPVVRVRPALTRDFVGDLRRQVNAAVEQAQRGVKPIVIKTVVQTPSRRALADLISAPVSLGAVTGHVTPTAGPAGGISSREQETINRLLKGNVQLLGLTEVAEEKVTQARQRSTAASKKQETSEQRLARLKKEMGGLHKTLANRIYIEATATGDLAKAQKNLRITTDVEEKALEIRRTAPSVIQREANALHNLAKAERTLALERVRSIETSAASGAAATTGSGFTAVQRRARASGVIALRASVELEREASAAFAASGKNAKDLAIQRDILAKRTDALNLATRAVKASTSAESDTLRVAAAATRDRLKTQVDQSKQLVAGLREQEKATRRAARSSEQLSRGGQASLLSLAGIRGATLAASRSFLVGAAAVTVFAQAVRSFANLETNLDVFRATTAATEEQMAAVREEARVLGADLTLPAVSAGDAADAMVELAKAGLTVTDSMNAARAVLELATAAAISNAEATRLVANVLNAFSLAGSDATTVADTLANAANAAQGSIADIGTAFQQAASAGRQVGLSFQDTATFLTILAKNGLRGSDAGTSLRTALIRLVNPSKKAARSFKELGLELRDSAGNLRPDIFLQIATATRDMAPAARDATIALIGGQDAFRAVTILGRQNVDTFIALRKQLRQAGTAADLAAARTKGFHGAIDALQSILETVGTTMASHVGPGISGFVYALGRGVTALSESNTLAEALEQTLTGVAGGFNIVAQTAKTLSVILLPATKLLLQLGNAVGVPTILAAVAAYKVLGGTIERVTKAVTAARTAWAALTTAQAASVAASGAASGFAVVDGTLRKVDASTTAAARSAGRFRLAITALTSVVNPYLLALGAVAGALTFILTRETEVERVTRRLTEATNEYANSISRLREARSAAATAATSVSSAELAVLDAQVAAANARNDLAKTPKGSVARERALLLVKVATDDIAAAQQRLNEALERENDLRLEALHARSRNLRARNEEVESIENLIRTSQKEPLRRGPTGTSAQREARAVDRLTLALSKQAEKAREAGDADSIRLAERIELLARLAKQLGELPPAAIDIAIDAQSTRAAVNQLADEFGEGGKEARRRFVAEISGATAREAAAGFLGEIRRIVALANDFFGREGEKSGGNFSDRAALGIRMRQAEIERAAEDAGRSASAAFARALRQSEFRQSKLATEEDLAVIGSSGTAATLSVEQQRLAEARADRATAEKRIAQLRASGRERGLDTAKKARADAIARERAAIEAIRGINETLASDAESAAKEAESKQDEIFENILKAMGIRRDAQQQRIEDAQLSEGLSDDIRQTRVLRQIAAKQIANLKTRIANARKQGINVATLLEGLRDLKEIWRDLGREIVDLQREQREALKDLAEERFDLRIRIAQARGDVAAEIRIRRQRLAELTAELVRLRKQYGKNSIEWLRAKAAQAEEVAAIKELQKQVDERNNAFAELSFSFLETQQGFAANLLNNLLPLGAIGNTVAGKLAAASGDTVKLPLGGGTGRFQGRPGMGGDNFFPFDRTGRNLSNAAVEAGAGSIAPPTRGQHATTNQLLHQILNVLSRTQQREKHPSSKQRQRAGSAVNDTQ